MSGAARSVLAVMVASAAGRSGPRVDECRSPGRRDGGGRTGAPRLPPRVSGGALPSGDPRAERGGQMIRHEGCADARSAGDASWPDRSLSVAQRLSDRAGRTRPGSRGHRRLSNRPPDSSAQRSHRRSDLNVYLNAPTPGPVLCSRPDTVPTGGMAGMHSERCSDRRPGRWRAAVALSALVLAGCGAGGSGPDNAAPVNPGRPAPGAGACEQGPLGREPARGARGQLVGRRPPGRRQLDDRVLRRRALRPVEPAARHLGRRSGRGGGAEAQPSPRTPTARPTCGRSPASGCAWTTTCTGGPSASRTRWSGRGRARAAACRR